MSDFYNGRGELIGWLDLEDSSTYVTVRDFNKGHIFRHPMYDYMIAVDVSLIHDLAEKGVSKVKILVKNFEKHSFWIIQNIRNIMSKGRVINHDKASEVIEVSTYYNDQYALPLKEWHKIGEG